MPQLTPVPAQRVEIISIVDNLSDVLLPNGPHVERPPRSRDGLIPSTTFLAEHGLCLLIRVHVEGRCHSVLMDSGYTSLAVPHNLELLGLDLNELEAIVLSHGHMDHTGSLLTLLDSMEKTVKVYAHPTAFESPRYMNSPQGERVRLPLQVGPEDIGARGGELVLNSGPELIAGGAILVSGQVEKTTGFEKGIPNAQLERNGELVADSIEDDQFIALRVAGQGLVVVSGCAHAGIVNTVRYAMKLTGEDEVHTVAGGFHLSGPLFEPIINETVEQLKALQPQVIVPMHCTGFKAQHRIAQEFDTQFVLNSVGSKIVVEAA